MSDFIKEYSVAVIRKAINPQNQLNFVHNEASPRIKQLEQAYGTASTKAWMMQMLIPVVGTSTNDAEMSRNLDNIIDILFERFYDKRASVWMLFCGKCAAHEYKISYGVVKVDAFLDAANLFLTQLHKLEEQASDSEQHKGRIAYGDIEFKPDYDTYKYLTLKGRLRCAWIDVHERLEKAGRNGILESLRYDDAYNAAIQICMKLNIMTITDRGVLFNEDLYNQKLDTLQ